MKFKIDSSLLDLTLDDYREMLSKYPFSVEDGSDIEIIWREGVVSTYNGIDYTGVLYPFPDDQYSVLITDCDNHYRGLTKVYGQTSVYWDESDIHKTKFLWRWVLRLRIAHEVLHHFNKPCHDIEEWLADKPLLSLLWVLGGSGYRYSICECLCKDLYYDYLFAGLDEQQFNVENRMDERAPNGVLIN